ncbi:MAG: 50S ribosomal protein L21 [Parcubacteria group bacterium]|nr:50S ribosomal protein L21 [Parcubacteria group bacterium]
MFAIIKTGGKQYVVKPGTLLTVDHLTGEVGSQVNFPEILLLVNDREEVEIGAPLIPNARVEGIILAQGKGEKLEVLTYKAKKRYRKHKGHRQLLTQVKIERILNR